MVNEQSGRVAAEHRKERRISFGWEERTEQGRHTRLAHDVANSKVGGVNRFLLQGVMGLVFLEERLCDEEEVRQQNAHELLALFVNRCVLDLVLYQ